MEIAIDLILIYGGILSITAGIFLFGILLFNPRLMRRSAPKEIKEKLVLTRNEKIQQLAAGVLLLAIIAWIAMAFTDQLRTRLGSLPFDVAFINVYLLFNVFNLFDLIVLDYLIICLWKPKFTIIPGFEKEAYLYQNFWFHFKGFLKGLVIGLVFSAIVAFLVA